MARADRLGRHAARPQDRLGARHCLRASARPTLGHLSPAPRASCGTGWSTPRACRRRRQGDTPGTPRALARARRRPRAACSRIRSATSPASKTSTGSSATCARASETACALRGPSASKLAQHNARGALYYLAPQLPLRGIYCYLGSCVDLARGAACPRACDAQDTTKQTGAFSLPLFLYISGREAWQSACQMRAFYVRLRTQLSSACSASCSCAACHLIDSSSCTLLLNACDQNATALFIAEPFAFAKKS